MGADRMRAPEANARRSLDALEARAEDAHRRLRDYRPEGRLVVDDGGEPDIEIGGQRLYGMPLGEHARRQLEIFWHDPMRIGIGPWRPEQLERFAGAMLNRSLARAAERGIPFQSAHGARTAYHVVVFGVGLGHPIEALITDTDCRHLVLVEPNLELLHHSLSVFDWDGLFRTMDARRGRTTFVLDDDGAVIADRLEAALRLVNPCSLDGTVMFEHYPNPVFVQARDSLGGKLLAFIHGLGFFDDEMRMIRNTHANLGAGGSRLFRRTPGRRIGAPVFIVGSGPSLDEDLPHLARNQRNAVVISCGTALRPLMRAGVVPDFHVEIENVPELQPLIEQAATEFDLSPVRLVASTTVDPVARSFFADPIYYFRAAMSSFPIFAPSDESAPSLAGINVASAGLAFAHELGFEEYYFFGMDMGARDPALRHSLDAWQNTDAGGEAPIVFDRTVPGNFGGRVQSFQDLVFTRETIEAAVRLFGRGRRYHNCSDGALIHGARAFSAASLALPPLEGAKTAVVSEIVDGFPVYAPEDVRAAWDEAEIIELVERLRAGLLAILAEEPLLRTRAYLARIMDLINPEERARSPWAGVTKLFRGALYQALMATEYYLGRVADPDRLAEMETIAREDLAAMVDAMAEEAAEGLGRLSSGSGTRA